jgi:hypothetical protein
MPMRADEKFASSPVRQFVGPAGAVGKLTRIVEIALRQGDTELSAADAADPVTAPPMSFRARIGRQE